MKLVFKFSPVFLMFALAAILVARPLSAQTLTTVHAFTGPPDGAQPKAGLVRDAQGNFYGTTAFGGTGAGDYCAFGGCGTVFKIDAAGNETVLYSFCSQKGNCAGGEVPAAGMLIDAQGNLYGTTPVGGSDDDGVVFKLDSSGVETVLHSFTGGVDGSGPGAGLIRDAQGNLYGTTSAGGDAACPGEGGRGCGVVFKLDTAGNETVLHAFTGATDGNAPEAGLIRDAQGNLYGTTIHGGGSNCGLGCGVVFKVDAANNETVLYAFTGGTDGGWPSADLIADGTGRLYGTTEFGGIAGCGALVNGCGVVFEVNAAGQETVLHAFTGSPDGEYPLAGLIHDAQGNFYGTTSSGGVAGYGGIFKMNTAGRETVYSFTGGADQGNPLDALIGDGMGNGYGTTFGEEPDGDCSSPIGCGTVFKITP